MLKPMRLSIVGLALAGIYALGAGWVVMVERVPSGEGWITLRHVDAAVAIGGCALLVYGLAYGLVDGLGYLGQVAFSRWTKMYYLRHIT